MLKECCQAGQARILAFKNKKLGGDPESMIMIKKGINVTLSISQGRLKLS